jgi:hypothetical protein
VSVNQERCWVIVCDDCAVTGGDEAHHDDGYTLHFPTETDALDWATDNGWTRTDTGIRCRRCSAQHFCGHLGHFYDLWQPCTCRGQLPAHATTGCPLIRACIYCGHHDLALLANLPTI